MTVYHGSYTEIKTPDLDFSRFNLDFGRGFYVTTLQEQAEKWAKRRTITAKSWQGITDVKPTINVYELNDNKLTKFAFEGYTEEWLDFVIKNRDSKEIPATSEYDLIFGNVADDDVAAVVDNYMDLLHKGRINAEDKRFFIGQLQYSKPNNQYCIATRKGLDGLKFIKSYHVEE